LFSLKCGNLDGSTGFPARWSKYSLKCRIRMPQRRGLIQVTVGACPAEIIRRSVAVLTDNWTAASLSEMTRSSSFLGFIVATR